jgi:quinol monooxygenase YgiN
MTRCNEALAPHYYFESEPMDLRHPKHGVAIALFLLALACGQSSRPADRTPASVPAAPNHRTDQMVVRISEIEIEPEHLAEYKAILKEEAAASVNLEPGVIAIFPMYQKETPTAVRILEIYASRGAYESHLKTPHFHKYKITTLKMVRNLKLIDMDTLDAETMATIFQKMGRQPR